MIGCHGTVIRTQRTGLEKTPWKFDNSSLYQTTARIWHDTLASIRAIRATRPPHAKTKNHVLKLWLSLGADAGLREGQKVMTLKGASEPSDKAYWMVPKR